MTTNDHSELEGISPFLYCYGGVKLSSVFDFLFLNTERIRTPNLKESNSVVEVQVYLTLTLKMSSGGNSCQGERRQSQWTPVDSRFL